MQKVKWVEVWAHSRSVSQPHQLHVDLDESRLRKGRAQYKLYNPVKHCPLDAVSHLCQAGGC